MGETMSASIAIRRRAPLASVSRIGIGGSAAWYVCVTTVPDLVGAVLWYDAHRAIYKNNPLMVIGGATNILFPDGNVPAFVVQNKASEIIPLDERTLWVGSGTDMDRLVKWCLKNGRAGFSWAGGLPGTIGGAIYGNAGAFGGQMDRCVVGVVSLEEKRGRFVFRYRRRAACAFGYRTSVFKQGAQKGDLAIIVGVIVRARHVGVIADEKKAVAYHRRYRYARHPMTARTLGSTFQNVPIKKIPIDVRIKLADRVKRDPFPVIPAAVLLDRAGCKKLRVGGASFSAQHANFIIASGKTRARDVRELCQKAQARVRRVFGVTLIPEIIMQEKFFSSLSSPVRRRKDANGKK